MCNGHADTCDIQDPNDPSVLLCRCQHNTCGAKCHSCCPGYEQKAWKQSKPYHPFICERKGIKYYFTFIYFYILILLTVVTVILWKALVYV